MDMQVEQIEGDVTKVILSGRLDIDGASAVDARFSVVGAAKRPVIVDMSGVEFLASMGIRTLLFCAKAIVGGGEKMVLFSAAPNVHKVLQASGIDSVIPVVPDQDAALSALSS